MVSFFILINVEACGLFNSTIGIRQEDPKSPYLFIILIEALGRNLKAIEWASRIDNVIMTPNCPLISHHQFIDDIIMIK